MPNQINSPLGSSSGSSSKISMNLQQRVLAFQEQRQQLKRSVSQSNSKNKNSSSIAQNHTQNIDKVMNIPHVQKQHTQHEEHEEQVQEREQDQKQKQKQEQEREQEHDNDKTPSPETPLFMSNSIAEKTSPSQHTTSSVQSNHHFQKHRIDHSTPSLSGIPSTNTPYDNSSSKNTMNLCLDTENISSKASLISSPSSSSVTSNGNSSVSTNTFVHRSDSTSTIGSGRSDTVVNTPIDAQQQQQGGANSRLSTPNTLNFAKTPTMTIVNKPLPPLPPPSRSNSMHSSQHTISRNSSISNSTNVMSSKSNNNSFTDLESSIHRFSMLSTGSISSSKNKKKEEIVTYDSYADNVSSNSSNDTISQKLTPRQTNFKDIGNTINENSVQHIMGKNSNNSHLNSPISITTDSIASLQHTVAMQQSPIKEEEQHQHQHQQQQQQAQPQQQDEKDDSTNINNKQTDTTNEKIPTAASTGFKNFIKQGPKPMRKPPPIPNNIPIQFNQNGNFRKTLKLPIMPKMPTLNTMNISSNNSNGSSSPSSPIPNHMDKSKQQQQPVPKMKMGLSARRGMKLDLSSFNNPVSNLNGKTSSSGNSNPSLGGGANISSNVNSLGSDYNMNPHSMNGLNINRSFNNTNASSTIISTESSSSSSSGSGSGSHGTNTFGSLLSNTYNTHSINSRNSVMSNNSRTQTVNSLGMNSINMSNILSSGGQHYNNNQHQVHSSSLNINNSRNSSGSNANSVSSTSSANKSMGLFANFSKYVNIKSGSLNFAGKLSLSSKGVDFSNGSSFRITLDELEYIGELGRGNYGNVSKVLHKPTNIVMAMKEVRLELDESKFRQILMELDILHRCNSPYIVDFYGAFFIEGAVYMCMECMDGGSLDKLYMKVPESQGIDEPRLAYIAISVINGLKTLKDEHNIIHRDVKPTNILCSALQGTVKLCDFGVSGNLVASLAKTNIGCQSYMAPERIKSFNPDAATYTVQSDIWSLGLSLLEMALGKYPYPPDTFDNIFSQLSAIVDGQPPRLPEDKFSPLAQDFISRCLEKQPDKRPCYAMLLEHPWLLQYKDVDVGMKEFLSKRVEEIEEYKKANKSPDDDEDTGEKKVLPALHNGGL